MHQLCLVRRENQLVLYFFSADSSEVMSRMDVFHPLRLVSPYTQGMLLTLLWNNNPNRVYVLGFGAGRVPMVMHHYFPLAAIECTELDEDVLTVAQSHFGIVLDERFTVAVEDGRKFLEKKTEPAHYNIIFVDAFSGTGGSPFSLATKEFYDLCQRHMEVGGVLSVNFLVGDELYEDKVCTLRSSFRNVYEVGTTLGGTVFFATNADSIPVDQLIRRAGQMANHHGFDFPFVERAHQLLQINQDGRATGHRYDGRTLTDADHQAFSS
jgi:spermidine synthase